MALYRCISTSGSATSITPSNASPVTLTANTAVKPTANGYAISSYSNITPSDAYPLGLNNGDIYKMGGNGYAIESYYDVIPSSAAPVTLAEGSFYKVGSNGIAIDAFYTITPSNSSPANLTSGTFYKMSGSGKAVASVTSKTPSDSSPASVAANSIIQPSAAGYLVSNTPVAMYNPDVTWQGNISSNGSKTITVTQTPRLVIHSYARYGDTNGYTVTRINDVLNNKHSDAYYLSSGYGEDKNADGLVGLTVSSTSITVNPNRNYTTRNMVFVFY